MAFVFGSLRLSTHRKNSYVSIILITVYIPKTYKKKLLKKGKKLLFKRIAAKQSTLEKAVCNNELKCVELGYKILEIGCLLQRVSHNF